MLLHLERRLVLFRTKAFWTTVNLLLTPPRGPIYFKSVWGGSLVATGELFERGLFYLAEMVVSVLHKELECKVEKLKYKKLEATQPRIKNIYMWRVMRGREGDTATRQGKALSTWQILVCSFRLCGFTDYRQGIIHWMTHYHVYCQALIKDEQIFGFPHCSSLHRCLTDTKGTLKFKWKHNIFSRKKFYHIWNSVLCKVVFMTQ